MCVCGGVHLPVLHYYVYCIIISFSSTPSSGAKERSTGLCHAQLQLQLQLADAVPARCAILINTFGRLLCVCVCRYICVFVCASVCSCLLINCEAQWLG